MCILFNSLRKLESSCEVILVSDSLGGYGGSLVTVTAGTVDTTVPTLFRLVFIGVTMST